MGSKTCAYKNLLDSGASTSVMNSSAVQHLECEGAKITSFKTVTGQFNCTKTCRTQIKMQELKVSAKIELKIYVTQMNGHYDVILRQYFLSFDYQLVWWDNKIVKMRPTECTQETSYYVNNTLDIVAEADHISKILDAKYQPADMDKVTAKKLTLEQQQNYMNC